MFASITTVQVDGIYYRVDNTTLLATVTYTPGSLPSSSTWNNYSRDIYIPSTIQFIDLGVVKTAVVTAVGDSAFYNCSQVRSIYISEGITTIGHSFMGNATIDPTRVGQTRADSLQFVSLPASLVSVGNMPSKSWNLQVEMRGATPPAYTQAAVNPDKSGIYLQVPDGATAYNTTPWSDYAGNIVGESTSDIIHAASSTGTATQLSWEGLSYSYGYKLSVYTWNNGTFEFQTSLDIPKITSTSRAPKRVVLDAGGSIIILDLDDMSSESAGYTVNISTTASALTQCKFILDAIQEVGPEMYEPVNIQVNYFQLNLPAPPTPTAVEQLEQSSSSFSSSLNGLYDLMGRRVSEQMILPHGTYIRIADGHADKVLK